MSKDYKELIEAWFADCTTEIEVAELYADLKMEVQKQMEFMINHIKEIREDEE